MDKVKERLNHYMLVTEVLMYALQAMGFIVIWWQSSLALALGVWIMVKSVTNKAVVIEHARTRFANSHETKEKENG